MFPFVVIALYIIHKIFGVLGTSLVPKGRQERFVDQDWSPAASSSLLDLPSEEKDSSVRVGESINPYSSAPVLAM